jgi:glucosamine 6-phosphate synthetase-like amidotransferase/phosphosugar isomerase protein
MWLCFVHGERERSVAATKTFTGQMMIFYLLAEALAGASGVTRGFRAHPGILRDKPSATKRPFANWLSAIPSWNTAS